MPETGKLRRENAALRDLIKHCWVHSGYADCGFMEMDTPLKTLYISIVGDGETVKQREEDHAEMARLRARLHQFLDASGEHGP